jgi:hypothetical protein
MLVFDAVVVVAPDRSSAAAGGAAGFVAGFDEGFLGRVGSSLCVAVVQDFAVLVGD